MFIAGFPGIGKTYFTKAVNNKLHVHDSDSSQFSKLEDGTRNPNFIKEYFDHLEKLDETNPDSLILVSTHADVLSELKNRGHDFVVIVPEEGQLDDYIKRYVGRGNDEAFIELLESNWSTWLEDIHAKYPNEVRVMNPGETLSGFATRIYETGI